MYRPLAKFQLLLSDGGLAGSKASLQAFVEVYLFKSSVIFFFYLVESMTQKERLRRENPFHVLVAPQIPGIATSGPGQI